MITMQEAYARAIETQIKHRLSQRPAIDLHIRPPTLRVRIGRGLIDAGLLLVGGQEPTYPEAA